MCNRHPEHIAAFVGFGQVVDGVLNEQLSWEFCMEEAEKAGDQKSIEILKKCGPPVMGDEGERFKKLLREKLMAVKEKENCVI